MRFRAVLAASIIAFTFLPSQAVDAQTDIPPILNPLDSTGIKHAVRLNPPPPPPPPVLWTTESSNGRCTGLIGALQYWSPGWDVNRMAGIAYRESRCDPNASNSCCSGMFQIHRSWISQLDDCGVFSRNDLYDPWKNVCAASYIYRVQGMSAWSQTL